MKESPVVYDDKLLFLRIAGGDEDAFTQIFHRYTPKLLPFIIKLTRNENIAKELVQETFLKLWVKRDQLGSIDNPSAYIYRIASNISITWLRTKSNRERILSQVVVTDDTLTPEDVFDKKQLNGMIANAIDLLPERRQEIYRLSREEGLSHQEIAERMGISVNTVKNQIGIALKFLRDFLSNETGLSAMTVSLLLQL